MADIETLIGQKITRSQKYLARHVNVAIQAHHEILIDTLQTAPRSEPELGKLIEQKRQELHKASRIEDTDHISNELDALEWLYGLLKVASIRPLTEDSIV